MTTAQDTRTALIDVGDVQLQCWERGDGPTILLVHASLFGDWFAPVFDEPALDGFRVIRVHRAGYGASPQPDRHLTFAATPDTAVDCSASSAWRVRIG
ncbi:MAG TPA: hypothetical protein VHS32_05215 [Streptosporangiaceae bacterium]|nr:hypothetical protein [Streptosporangiaceae bacterium]